FYGVIFLGQPREETLKEAHDAGPWELAGLAWLALQCVLLGVFPVAAIVALSPAVEVLVPASLAPSAAGGSWWFLTSVAPERASYAPLLFLLVILLA
ncbi:hydrogenase 4 subunit B, partial [Pelomicrobium sp. G1]